MAAAQLRLRLILLPVVIAACFVPTLASGYFTSDGGKVERRVGTLEIGHYDVFPHGSVRHFARLVTKRGEIVNLRFRGDAPEHLTGLRAAVRGRQSGRTLRVTNLRILGRKPAAIAPLSSVSAAAPLAINVAVINVNFENDASQPWTPDAIRNVMFANANAVSAYWAEVAYGKIAIRGDVYGWHTIPHDNSGCAYSTWAAAAKNALAADGVDLAQYQKFVYAFPRTSCSWAGLGGGSQAWLNGTISHRIAAHEVGHTLSLGHSKSLSCTQSGTRVSLASDLSTCSVSEYGDPFDVMGSASTRHTSNVGKAVRGWMESSRVQTVTASGTYALASPADPAGTAPQILRVRRTDGSWLNLEARKPYGQYFDTFPASDPVVNGVTVRWTSTTTSASPQLVDCTPETTGFSDAALAAGKSLTDSAGGVQVTTLSVSSTGASVQVQLGGGSTPPADTQPPTAPSPLSATASSSTTASLSWPAATDNVGVANYRVFRNGALLATTTGRTYSDGGRTAGATYGYGVAAVDAAGNVGTTAEASVTMPTATDTQAPTAPAPLSANAASETTASLTWPAATDNVAVASYRVLRDGALLGTTTSRSYSDGGRTAGTTYRYAVAAVDTSGNVGPAAEATLTMPSAPPPPPPPPPPPTDTTAPSAPTNLVAAAGKGKKVQLTWTLSSDDTAVHEYRVYRDGALVGTVLASSLRAGEPYYIENLGGKSPSASYIVLAVDAADTLPGFCRLTSRGPRSPARRYRSGRGR